MPCFYELVKHPIMSVMQQTSSLLPEVLTILIMDKPASVHYQTFHFVQLHSFKMQLSAPVFRCSPDRQKKVHKRETKVKLKQMQQQQNPTLSHTHTRTLTRTHTHRGFRLCHAVVQERVRRTLRTLRILD